MIREVEAPKQAIEDALKSVLSKGVCDGMTKTSLETALVSLNATVPSLALLEKTMVGKTVNKLTKKHLEEIVPKEIAEDAMKLVEKWKQVVLEGRRTRKRKSDDEKMGRIPIVTRK